jgi:hypothetical protein
MNHHFSSGQLVTVAVALCAAVALSSLVGQAASQAIGGAVSMQVDTRPGVRTGAFNAQEHPNNAPGFHELKRAIAPASLAITEVTLASEGVSNTDSFGVELLAIVNANSNCNGGTRVLLRWVAVVVGETLALDFDGVPLYVPKADAGKRVCFGYRVVLAPAHALLAGGALGYRFTRPSPPANLPKAPAAVPGDAGAAGR